MTPEVRAKIGVEEPLDGILIGAASGGGFAIMETLLQYTPQTWSDMDYTSFWRFRGFAERTADRMISTR